MEIGYTLMTEQFGPTDGSLWAQGLGRTADLHRREIGKPASAKGRAAPTTTRDTHAGRRASMR
jgi:hypothetical protein